MFTSDFLFVTKGLSPFRILSIFGYLFLGCGFTVVALFFFVSIYCPHFSFLRGGYSDNFVYFFVNKQWKNNKARQKKNIFHFIGTANMGGVCEL